MSKKVTRSSRGDRCGNVRNRCKKPHAIQAEQTTRIEVYVYYSIMVMKTKDLRTKVTAKIPPRRAKTCICHRKRNRSFLGLSASEIAVGLWERPH